jgi:phosphoribosylglycinamide formyltransferase-1
MTRVAVLASGNGSNFQALVENLHARGVARVVRLVTNVPTAGVIERARRLLVPTTVLDHRQFESRETFDESVASTLRADGATIVCLAGYMRLLSRSFLDAYPQRVLNIHPSLLPSFPGLHAARQALQHGVRVTGVTVHLVDAGLDSGPILAQAPVAIEPKDDEAALLERIHAEEHRLYPRVVEAVARGAFAIEGRRVVWSGAAP